MRTQTLLLGVVFCLAFGGCTTRVDIRDARTPGAINVSPGERDVDPRIPLKGNWCCKDCKPGGGGQICSNCAKKTTGEVCSGQRSKELDCQGSHVEDMVFGTITCF